MQKWFIFLLVRIVICDPRLYSIEIKADISNNLIQHDTFISDIKKFSLMLLTIDESYHNLPKDTTYLLSNNTNIQGTYIVDHTKKIYGINTIYLGTFILFVITFLIDCLLSSICNVVIENEVNRLVEQDNNNNTLEYQDNNLEINEEQNLRQCYWICFFLFLRSINIGLIFPLLLIKFVYEYSLVDSMALLIN